jgi:O-antigen ligase
MPAPSDTAAAHWPFVAPSPAVAGEPAAVRRGRFAFGAVAAFVFVQIVAPHFWIPALAPLRPALLAASAAIVAVLLERTSRGEALLPGGREVRVAMALAAWILVTVPFSYWPGGSVGAFTDTFAKSLAMFWLLVQVITTLDRYTRFMWVVSLCAVVPAMIGVKNYLTGAYLPGSQRVEGYLGSGLTENPNDLALVLNLVLPFAIVLLRASSSVLARLVAVGMIGLFVVGVVVTFSRGGFITLAVSAVVYLAKLTRQGRPGIAWAIVVAAVLALPLMPASYVSRIATIGDTSSDATNSAQERWRDLGVAAKYIAMHPVVGAGFGQSALALNDVRGAAWVSVHNMYLEYGVDLGIPGMVMFVLVLVYAVRNADAARRTAAALGERRLFLAADGLHVSLIAFATAAFFHPCGALSFLFFYLAGLALALRHLAASASGSTAHAAA